MDEWVGIDEAADVLGVSPSTVRADVAAHRLRSRDLGSHSRPRWLVSRAHLDEIAAGGGRTDRRKIAAVSVDAPSSSATDSDLGSRVEALESERTELHIELDDTRARIAQLEGDVKRLEAVARNANVAVQAQTESLQQFLMEEIH